MNDLTDGNMNDLTDDVIPDDEWVSIAYILGQHRAKDKPKVTVALLREVIEVEGVKTYDRWGRLVSAIAGNENESTSKAYVYKLLANYYAELRASYDLPPGVHPDQDPDRWLEYFSPLNEFGWPKDEVPDFVEWIAKSNQVNKKQVSTSTIGKKQDDWKMQAVKIADELFDRDTKNGSRDSLLGYSGRVMEEMQKHEIHAPRGRMDNAKTIMREALQGDKWWKGKKK